MIKYILVLMLLSPAVYAKGGGGHGGGHSSGHSSSHSSSHSSGSAVNHFLFFNAVRPRVSSSGKNTPSNTRECVENPKWYQLTAKKCNP